MTPAEFRAARKALGLTQAELALAIGFRQQSTISEMETGHATITARTAAAVRLLLAANPDSAVSSSPIVKRG